MVSESGLNPPSFHDKRGKILPCASSATITAIRRELASTYGITPIQMVECAGFSMAMVVRAALGLSALGGEVVVLVRDCLAGMIALAAARHLHNSGGHPRVIVLPDMSSLSETARSLLKPLAASRIEISEFAALNRENALNGMLGACHNAIAGVFSPEHPGFAEAPELISLLNELRTPIHAIEAPLGINVDSGAAQTPLYASSTLSLGIPLQGLLAAHEFVGRHYLCDINIPPALAQRFGVPMPALFDEQPVIQIFPPQAEQSTGG